MKNSFRSDADRTRAIAELAYRFWEERGRPEGSAEEDWYKAELEIGKSGRSARSSKFITGGRS